MLLLSLGTTFENFYRPGLLCSSWPLPNGIEEKEVLHIGCESLTRGNYVAGKKNGPSYAMGSDGGRLRGTTVGERRWKRRLPKTRTRSGVCKTSRRRVSKTQVSCRGGCQPGKCEWWMVEGIFSTNQYRCKW